MKFPHTRLLTAVATATSLLLTTSSCQDDLLDKINPNQPQVSQYWKTQDDAVKGVTAAYAMLQLEGSYGRWIHFAYDLRSDEGYSNSPWTDLANSTRFLVIDYNFVTVASPWTESYRGVYRCNQVLANVPAIQMDEQLKKRLLAEAHFLRALYYWNLVTLWGNVPLINSVAEATSRFPQGTVQQGWEFILADLQAAETDLPLASTYSGLDRGRASKGAAQTLMGKVYMQQRKWAEAQTQFAKVISSTQYELVANYLDNFTMANENNRESIFEVQFSDALQGDGQDTPGASEGNNRAQFFGPRGIGWSDGQPRRWLFTEFTDRTVDGQPDPRRDITVFNSSMLVYGKTYAERGFNDPNELFWRKYQNDRTRTFENYHSGINFRVMRYADVLLMQAEALNEQGQPAAALPLINQVRARVNVVPLAGSFTQAQMKTQLLHERVTELAGENTRWTDLQRSGLLDNQAGVTSIVGRDSDFNNFVVGKSIYYPIPRTDVQLDPNLKQNPGY